LILNNLALADVFEFNSANLSFPRESGDMLPQKNHITLGCELKFYFKEGWVLFLLRPVEFEKNRWCPWVKLFAPLDFFIILKFVPI
jgi:hypothetical protein